jgi:hypothetical protein
MPAALSRATASLGVHHRHAVANALTADWNRARRANLRAGLRAHGNAGLGGRGWRGASAERRTTGRTEGERQQGDERCPFHSNSLLRISREHVLQARLNREPSPSNHYPREVDVPGSRSEKFENQRAELVSLAGGAARDGAACCRRRLGKSLAAGCVADGEANACARDEQSQ